MNIGPALLIATCSVGFLLAVIMGLSRHKKSAGREVNVIGAVGSVDAKLNPEGTVIVDGELWRARAVQNTVVKPGTKVRVVALQAHLLLVEPAFDKV